MKSTRIWDLPTRIFHWALVLCVTGLIISGNVGGNAMTWHFRFGYSVLALLIFRLSWGLIGGRWSRFSSFIYSPSSIIKYLKGEGHPHHSIGHNPLGAFSVFSLLVFLAAQVATGLFSDDDIATSGPFSKFVSDATVRLVSGYHTTFGKIFIVVLVLLHVGAILYYLYKKRENLIQPMIHGDKVLPLDTPASRDDTASRAVALLLFAASAALVYWLVSLGG